MDRVTKDLTVYGVINTSLYLAVNFALLPLLQFKFNMKISMLYYVIWYVWSIAYTIYVIYVIYKGPQKQTNIEKVTYNWFMKGGYKSYQDIFILTEREPLYEYALLGIIILIPTKDNLSVRRKFEIVLYKIALFHITASLLLMDWKELVVNYEFRNVDDTIE